MSNLRRILVADIDNASPVFLSGLMAKISVEIFDKNFTLSGVRGKPLT